MRTRYSRIALVFALALWACGGDDDTSSGDGDDPFGNANTTGNSGNPSSAGSGGRTGTGTGTGTGPVGASSTDADAGSMMRGDHMGPGMMMPGTMMMRPPMEMCPATKPEDASACKGHRMCTFDDLECRCEHEAWSCG